MSLANASTFLATLALLGGGVGLILLLLLCVPTGRARLAREMEGQIRGLLGLAWLAAFLATAGSLYLSDVVGFTPCLLCWYQRIAMYPLVLILGVAIVGSDRRVWRYVLPLTVGGGLISVYHVVIQFRPVLDVGACSEAVPCTLRYLSVFGFVSTPMMAGLGFLLISALVLAARHADPELSGPPGTSEPGPPRSDPGPLGP